MSYKQDKVKILRIASIKGGLSEATPSFTVNKVCGSGMKAIQLAYQSIALAIMRL